MSPVTTDSRTAQVYNSFNPIQKAGFVCQLLFIFLFYSRLPDFYLTSLHLPMVFALLSVAAAFTAGSLPRVLQSRITLAILGFTLWFMIAMVFSTWRTGSLQVFEERWVKALMIFVCIAGLINTPKELSRTMRFVAYAVTAAGALALRLNATSWDGRLLLPVGELGNSNQLALVMIAGLPCCWLIAGSRRYHFIHRLVAMGFMGILLVTISKTGSRSALIALAALSIAFFIRLPFIGKIGFAVVLTLMVGGATLVMPDMVQKRFATLWEDESPTDEALQSANASTASRMALLKDSIAFTAKHPLFGVGPGNYSVFRNDELLANGRHGDWTLAHNSYTQISSECGVPALVFYVAALVMSYKRTLKAEKVFAKLPRHSRGIEDMHQVAFCLRLCLLGVSTFIFFGNNAYEMYLPTFTAMAVALEYCTQQQLYTAALAAQQLQTAAPLMAPRALQPAYRRS